MSTKSLALSGAERVETCLVNAHGAARGNSERFLDCARNDKNEPPLVWPSLIVRLGLGQYSQNGGLGPLPQRFRSCVMSTEAETSLITAERSWPNSERFLDSARNDTSETVRKFSLLA